MVFSNNKRSKKIRRDIISFASDIKNDFSYDNIVKLINKNRGKIILAIILMVIMSCGGYSYIQNILEENTQSHAEKLGDGTTNGIINRLLKESKDGRKVDQIIENLSNKSTSDIKLIALTLAESIKNGKDITKNILEITNQDPNDKRTPEEIRKNTSESFDKTNGILDKVYNIMGRAENTLSLYRGVKHFDNKPKYDIILEETDKLFKKYPTHLMGYSEPILFKLIKNPKLNKLLVLNSKCEIIFDKLKNSSFYNLFNNDLKICKILISKIISEIIVILKDNNINYNINYNNNNKKITVYDFAINDTEKITLNNYNYGKRRSKKRRSKKRRSVKRKSVKRKSVKRKSVKRKSVKRKSVKRN
jgi:hypothetical protein